MNSDADYYARRAREEHDFAHCTADPTVAEIHLALARLYEERIADPQAWATISTQEND